MRDGPNPYIALALRGYQCSIEPGKRLEDVELEVSRVGRMIGRGCFRRGAGMDKFAWSLVRKWDRAMSLPKEDDTEPEEP